MFTHFLAVLGVLFIFYVIPSLIQEAWIESDHRGYTIMEIIKSMIFTPFCVWAICHWLHHFNLI